MEKKRESERLTHKARELYLMKYTYNMKQLFMLLYSISVLICFLKLRLKTGKLATLVILVEHFL